MFLCIIINWMPLLKFWRFISMVLLKCTFFISLLYQPDWPHNYISCWLWLLKFMYSAKGLQCPSSEMPKSFHMKSAVSLSFLNAVQQNQCSGVCGFWEWIFVVVVVLIWFLVFSSLFFFFSFFPCVAILLCAFFSPYTLQYKGRDSSGPDSPLHMWGYQLFWPQTVRNAAAHTLTPSLAFLLQSPSSSQWVEFLPLRSLTNSTKGKIHKGSLQRKQDKQLRGLN